jgi:4-amino-4-deoxy-L-arabinose transferase-like glycosyltransferase
MIRNAASRGTAIVVVVCLLALVLRVIGLQYGLPAIYNPDEVAIMARALSFATGTLNPHNFLYPTFYFYVLFAWVGVYLAFMWLTGRVESLAAMQRLYFTDQTGIFTAGRTLGVAAGTATVFLLLRLAGRLTDPRAAIAAAVFLAISPLHVRDSHYVKHDVPATLAIVMAYLAMTKVWLCQRPEGPLRRDTILAGAACGVAFSTHYYCIFLAIPLTFAIVSAWKTRGSHEVIRQLAWGAAASALVFFALSPFLLVEPATAWRDITANRQIVVDRAVSAGAFAPALRYADMLWTDAFGPVIALLGLAGALWMLISVPLRAVFLLSFPVPFLVFIANTAPASRYLNPVLPFVAIFAAWLLSVLGTRLRARPVVFWIAVALAAAPGLVGSVKADLFLRQDDTRTLAERFIETNVPIGSTILIQPYSVALTPSREGLVEALTRNLGSADRASTKFKLQLSLDPYPQPSYRLIYLGRGGMDAEKIYVDPQDLGGDHGLEPLQRLGVAFLAITRYNRPDPATWPFLTALAREGRRVAVFSPFRPGIADEVQSRIDPFLHNTDARIDAALERPGPRTEIWRID